MQAHTALATAGRVTDGGDVEERREPFGDFECQAVDMTTAHDDGTSADEVAGADVDVELDVEASAVKETNAGA
jgi:hypothetical protein